MADQEVCYICRDSQPVASLLRSDCLSHCNCWYHRECASIIRDSRCPMCLQHDPNRPFSMESTMRNDLFLKDHYGTQYEKEVVTWYVKNLPLIEAYPHVPVIKAVVDAFIADCNMYAVRVAKNHELWKDLNKEAVENGRQRIELLLQDEKNKKQL